MLQRIHHADGTLAGTPDTSGFDLLNRNFKVKGNGENELAMELQMVVVGIEMLVASLL